MTIVAPIDSSDRSTDVISGAEDLAEAFDDTIHVVHVLNKSEFVELGRTAAEDGDAINMEQIRDVAAEIAAERVSNLAVPVETVGLVGDPASSIVEYAESQDARYIVIGGKKRSPVGKAIFGSVTQDVLLNATCSVVTTISS